MIWEGGGGGGTWEPRAENVRWWCWVRPVDPRRVGSGPVAGRLLRKAFWSCPLLVKAAPREGRGGLSNGFRPPLRWFGSGTKSTGFIFFPGASFPNSSLDTANQLAWHNRKNYGATDNGCAVRPHGKDLFGSYFPALFLESHSKILLLVKIVSKFYIEFYFGISQSQYKVVKKRFGLKQGAGDDLKRSV